MEEITHQTQDHPPVLKTTNELVFNSELMEQVSKLAEIMATGKATVPKHLQGSTGDCFAIIMQASQWQMNPFAVAQKTHLVNGVLGYEAQLVNAVISSSSAIQGRFYYEYQGEWKNHNDANSAVRVGAVLKNEQEITWGEWLYPSTVKVKNSPLWNTAPKQQAGYLAVKYWARLYCPDVILGVYSPDEFETSVDEKVINPIPEATPSKTDQVKAKIKANTQKESVIDLEPPITNFVDELITKIELSGTREQLDTLLPDVDELSDEQKKQIKPVWSQKLKEFKQEAVNNETAE